MKTKDQNTKQQIKKLLDEIYLLAKNDTNGLESKLAMYQFCASSFWHNYSGTFVHHQLEEDLIQISENIIDYELDHNFVPDHVLHVMTEAYDTGGHTRVVENWIKATPHRHSVVFNNPYSPMPNFLRDVIQSKNGSIILNDKNNFVEKANYLAQVASRFKYIVLHHHPHDILPLLAFGTKKFTRPIFFYNHADHVWGCGYSVSDKLVEICTQGIQHSINYRGIPQEKTFFAGIPIDLPEKNNNKSHKPEKYLVSMASSFKYKAINNLSFQDFIDKVLTSQPSFSFYAIGVSPSDKDWEWLIEKYPDRIYLKGLLPKNEAHEIIKKATVYLDSFPLGSSTSLLEAMSLGIPVLSYAAPIQHMDAYKEYSYNSLEGLYNALIKILNYSEEERAATTKFAFQYLHKWHSLESFRNLVMHLDSIEQRNPIKLSKQITNDLYIETYTDFMFQLLSQKKFNFDLGQLDLLMDNQKKSLTIKLGLDNFLENSILLHGNKDWYDLITQNTKLFSQLFLDHGNGISEENSIKLPVVQNTEIQEFIFDLSDKPILTNLRLDPLNDSCVIEIENLLLIKNDGSEINLMPNLLTNACSQHDNNTLYFEFHDPQIYFNSLDTGMLSDVKAFIAKIRYAHIARDAVHVCANQLTIDRDYIIDQTKTELDQTKTELDQTKTELDQTKTELDSVYLSKSWKITKPLRKIQQILKGN